MSAVERIPLDQEGWSLSAAVAVDANAPGRWIHISGLTASAGSEPVPEGLDGLADMEWRANSVFDQFEDYLRRAGGELSNIVRMRVYLTEPENYAALSKVRSARFAGNYPASTSVQVAGLLGGEKLEIDAVAFIPES
ncbi:MAG TPA: RidA family protein [Actinomycetaceae bacterium]|nr:RidA family protein [Actinomycetaceae bacterium]